MDSTTLMARHGQQEVPVSVVRKRVKNLNLRVRANGSVVLSVPLHTSMEAAEAFLARKASWIAKHVARRANSGGASNQNETEQMVTAWEQTHLWGDPFPINGLVEGIDVGSLHAREVQCALPRIAGELESAMGVNATRWTVRRMKTRWGSCTPATGAIRINARLAAYPPECLEFVVAHELVHLMEPSHNQRFHMLLDIYCPRNRELAALLRHAPQQG